MKKSIAPKPVVYPTPVFVVGTYDAAGRPNGATVAWGGICCSRPPCVAVSLRKATYSHGNIVARGAFTVNVPSERYTAEADFFGIVSGRHVDKFAATGLTPVRSERVDAPIIQEFPLALECRLLQTVEIGLHTQFIGEIVGIQADESVVGEKDVLDIEKVRPILYAPDNAAYFAIGPGVGQAFSVGKRFGG